MRNNQPLPTISAAIVREISDVAMRLNELSAICGGTLQIEINAQGDIELAANVRVYAGG